MIPDEPMVPGAPLRLRSILLWQTVAIGCGIEVQVYLDRGAPFSVFLGAFLMSGSLVLSRLAFRYATQKKKRPFLAMFFFFLKLSHSFAWTYPSFADKHCHRWLSGNFGILNPSSDDR